MASDRPGPRDHWTPPDYEVDADGKVVGAKPGSPHNWGRWGEDDQIGTANLLTPERAVQASTLIRTGRSFSLSVPFGRGARNLGTRHDPIHLLSATGTDNVAGASSAHHLQDADDLVVLPLQAATHLDGLAHVGRDDTLYNGFWAGTVSAREGATRLSADRLATGLIGRCVLVDAARHADLDPFRGVVDVAVLESTLRAQGVDVGPGDVMLLRTGWIGAYTARDRPPRTRSCGLAPSTLEWIADRDVAMVAADNRTVEALPNPEGTAILPFHRRALHDLGLLLGELFALDELAAHCARTGVYEAFFCAAPLPLTRSVGTPLNPLVIV
ncbi:cyclase family protein [Pseudonocardia pini]|uniref:cyclase family protein n=1 Tax=Pseudonocardia pini TaxID=2758030 RepID=UPI0015F0683E|nr:cyclase family protein [Pseudonocardia pini]